MNSGKPGLRMKSHSSQGGHSETLSQNERKEKNARCGVSLCNFSTWETEAGGLLPVEGQPKLQGELQDSQRQKGKPVNKQEKTGRWASRKRVGGEAGECSGLGQPKPAESEPASPEDSPGCLRREKYKKLKLQI